MGTRVTTTNAVRPVGRAIRMFAVGALVFGACGGGSSDKAGPTTTASTTTSTSSSSTTTTSTAPQVFGAVPTTTTLLPGMVPVRSVAEEVGVDSAFRQTRINGVVYSNALVIYPSAYANERRLEIDAGRSYRTFVGDLGIPDDQKSSTAYKVDISLDGSAPTYSADVRFGETKKINLNITNVLRIKIVLTPISNSGGYVAIGDPGFSG